MNNILKRLLMVLSFITIISSSQAIDLSWEAVTNNVDGTDLSLGGYKVYYGKVSGSYTTNIDAGLSTNITLPNQSFTGSVYFAVSAYDLYDNEGALSDPLLFYTQTPNFPVISSYSYNAKTGKATITFAAPTKNVDGTSCSGQLSGYIIGFGQSSRLVHPYDNFNRMGLGTQYVLTIPTNSGVWYWSISATNIYKNIGPYSAEASFGTSSPDKPGKPKGDPIDLRY